MATQSRARMFYGTAKALNTVAERRLEDPMHALLDRSDAIAHDDDADAALLADEDAAAALDEQFDDARAVDRAALRSLQAEYRWAESRLMQASERLAEAQEARRKDLVALAVMRRELRASFAAERAYVLAQIGIFEQALLAAQEREIVLAEILDSGAATESVIRELAEIRAERKLHALAIAQARAQVARIADNDATLEHEVASEAYDREPDGKTMRELGRLRAEQARSHRAALRARTDVRHLLTDLDMDTSFGEIAASAAFLAAEFEGDTRSIERMQAVREGQIAHELRALPQPAKEWKVGLRHPVALIKARKA